jgi:hypothetical protein
MNQIYSVYIKKLSWYFFDDIQVFSKTREEHIEHLRQALQILRENSLIAKQSKCVFAVPQVEYLRHIITAAGVSTDPSKIEAIRTWQTPQLKSFLDLNGYYRRFKSNMVPYVGHCMTSSRNINSSGNPNTQLHFKN